MPRCWCSSATAKAISALSFSTLTRFPVLDGVVAARRVVEFRKGGASRHRPCLEVRNTRSGERTDIGIDRTPPIPSRREGESIVALPNGWALKGFQIYGFAPEPPESMTESES